MAFPTRLLFLTSACVAATLAWPSMASTGDGGGGELPVAVIHADQDLMLAGGSGGGGGDLPFEWELEGTESVIRVSNVRGLIAASGGSGGGGGDLPHSADGAASRTSLRFESAEVGGVFHDSRDMYLAGVFLSGSGGGGGDLPAPVDLSLADGVKAQAPALAEPFWIGNGRVGAAGDRHTIRVPKGADSLWVGFVEGGASPDYSDNVGRVRVRLDVIASVIKKP